jgi:hypothetical protein
MNTTDRTEAPEFVDKAFDHKGNAVLLLHEDLARARMRESQRAAAQARLARRLGSARRWHRLAEWASRHASKADAGL